MSGLPAVPLSVLKPGEKGVIVKIRNIGDEDMQHHLENLGFVGGAEVEIASENGGNQIVVIKGAQVALDSGVCRKITVQQ